MRFLILLSFIFLIYSCNNDENRSSDSSKKTIKNESPGKKKKKSNQVNGKIEKKKNIEIKKDKPLFILVQPVYKANKSLKEKDLMALSEMELALLRVQLYSKNNYDFETPWKRDFYKAKYGYLIKPDYNQLDMKAIDRNNDLKLVAELQRKRKVNKKYNSLPIYTGHILREINRYPKGHRYFVNIKDDKAIHFNNDDMPDGIFDPQFGREITKSEWKALMQGKAKFSDLKFPENHRIVYLVKYYPNKNIKYIISYEAYGGVLSPQDAKNFSLYDLKGILRRSVYLVGDSDTYEKDYFYGMKGEVIKIVEKIARNNQLSRVRIYKKNTTKLSQGIEKKDPNSKTVTSEKSNEKVSPQGKKEIPFPTPKKRKKKKIKMMI